MSRFKDLHLHKFCKSNSFLTREEAKKKFLDPAGLDPELVSILEWQNDIRDQMDGSDSGRSYCRATNEGLFLGRITQVDNRMNVNGYEVPTITCSRVFKEEEWKEGIPYERNNLRHWKKGYKQELEELTWEQLKEDMYALNLSEAWERG